MHSFSISPLSCARFRRARALFFSVSVVTAFLLVGPTPLSAQIVDAAFGELGHERFNRTGADEEVEGMAIDSQGRILHSFRLFTTADEWKAVVVRYNSDGSLDSSFGFLGFWVEPTFETLTHTPICLTVDDSDRPIVGFTFGFTQADHQNHDWYIRRLTEGGSIDQSAVVAFDIGSAQDRVKDELLSLAYSSGKLVGVGRSESGLGDFDMTISVLNATESDIAYDTSFSSNGRDWTHFDLGGSNLDEGTAVVFDGGDYIVTGNGETENGSNFVVAKFLAGGNLDSGFGSAGKVSTAYLASLVGVPNEVNRTYGAVGLNGGVILSGYTAPSPGATEDAAFVRLSATGTLDTSWGNFNGWTTVPMTAPGALLGTGDSVVYSVQHLPNPSFLLPGSLIGAGQVFNRSTVERNGAVVVLTEMGQIDNGFRPGGYQRFVFEPEGETEGTGFFFAETSGFSHIVVGGVMKGIDSGQNRADTDAVLSRIRIRGLVLEDGFESGNTSRWNS